MVTVEPTDVRSIGNFEMLDNDDISGFISDAEGYVIGQVGESVPDSTSETLVKWVAAHLSSMKQKRIESEEFTDSAMNYEGRTGMKLKFTRYGQQAIVLDPTGKLGTVRRYTTSTHSEPDYEPLDDPGYPGEWRL